jgi:hypothetical protein
MGALQPPPCELDHPNSGFRAEGRAELDVPEVWPEEVWPEVDALVGKIRQLLKKNEELRGLVTRLSTLVIRNVVDRES